MAPDGIFKFANVVGHGVGYKVKDGVRTSELCRVVMVERKLPLELLAPEDVIPKVINGEVTDIIQAGRFKAYWGERTSVMRPAMGGISIGHPDITAGTLGCAVWIDGKKHILSNNHVMADMNDASIGDGILQPGDADSGTEAIAALTDFQTIDFDGGSNVMDAAIALPYTQSNLSEEIYELGLPQTEVAPSLGLVVTKSGRTTAVTTGEIDIIDATIEVDYTALKTAIFDNVFIDSYNSMSSPGDSGSLLVASDGLAAVGILFAGEGIKTAFNPVGPILTRFSATMLRQHSEVAVRRAGKTRRDYLLNRQPLLPVGAPDSMDKRR